MAYYGLFDALKINIHFIFIFFIFYILYLLFNLSHELGISITDSIELLIELINPIVASDQ